MNIITRSVEFEAGHRVLSHRGKCQHPHGHRYKVEAALIGPPVDHGPEQGMVADFGVLKDCLYWVTDRLDHAMLVWEHDAELLGALAGHDWGVVTLPVVPTAEGLAQVLFKSLALVVAQRCDYRVGLQRVTVWETPTTSATYVP